jgi:hypothetical protein
MATGIKSYAVLSFALAAPNLAELVAKRNQVSERERRPGGGDTGSMPRRIECAMRNAMGRRRRDTRAGHYERGLQSKAGEVWLRVLKLKIYSHFGFNEFIICAGQGIFCKLSDTYVRCDLPPGEA